MTIAEDILFMLDRVRESDHNTIKGQAYQLGEKIYEVAQESPAFQRYAAVEQLAHDAGKQPAFRHPIYTTPPNLETAKSDAFLIFRAVANRGDTMAFELFRKNTMEESHHHLMHTVFPYFERAVGDIIDDLKASGKWAVLEGQKIDTVDLKDEELPIPPEHRPIFAEALKATEERLLAAIEHHHGATQYAVSLSEDIRRMVRSIDSKASRIGRKDMVLLVLGTLLSVASSGVIPPDAVRSATEAFMAKVKSLSVALIG